MPLTKSRRKRTKASANYGHNAIRSRLRIGPKQRAFLCSLITVGNLRDANPNIKITDSAGKRVPNSVALIDID